MALYKILAYVGSIWSFITYVPLLVIAIFSSVLLRDIMPILQQTQEQSFLFMSSMMNLVFLLGIIGIAMSITVIIATRKIKPIMKRLPIILIIAGIVFVVLQWVQYSYMEDVFDIVTAGLPYYGTAEAEFEDNFFGKLSESFVIGIIPSIILIVSGMLAFRIYRKPRNPILDSNTSQPKKKSKDETKWEGI